MPDEDYHRAIFADPSGADRRLAHFDLSCMVREVLEALFADIYDKVQMHEGAPCNIQARDLRAALNNHARPRGSWWPPVSGPVAECLDWHRTNTGVYLDGPVEGSGDGLIFVVRSETLDRRLAAAFDPAPDATAHIEADFFDGNLDFTEVVLPWLLPASRPELTQVRRVAQAWREEWAELLRWRSK